jgi:hypothetical protein
MKAVFSSHRLIGLASAIGIATASVAMGQSDPYCHILDRIEEPIWELYGTYVEEVPGSGFEKLGMFELGGSSGLFYYRGTRSTLDVRGHVDTLSLTGKGSVPMPKTVAKANVDFDYALRLPDGLALRMGFAPGVYSEVSGLGSDSFYYPFRLHVLRVLTPDSSGMAGIDFYPGFDRLLHPRIGARWAVSEYLLFDIFYPETRLVFRPTWWISFHAGVQFNDFEEYRLKSSDNRKSLMIRETRMFLGTDVALTSQTHLMIQFGRIADREIDFRENAPRRKLDDAYFARVGIGGRI